MNKIKKSSTQAKAKKIRIKEFPTPVTLLPFIGPTITAFPKSIALKTFVMAKTS